MATSVTLTRPTRSGPLISLVPMIDVMLILLVFFMVTSTYLNLDMIPAVQQHDSTASSTAPAAGDTVMIRLGASGQPVVAGRPVSMDDLADLLRTRLADDSDLRVLILPSGAARTQALISTMDAATGAGVQQLQVIRLEAQP